MLRHFFTKKIALSAAVLFGGIAGSLFIIGSPAKQIEGVTVAAASSTNPQLGFTVSPLPNLTNEFTDQALSKLVAQNQANAQDATNIKTVPNASEVEKIVSDIIDSETAKEKPDVSKVHQSTDDSREMQIAYLVAINTIIENSIVETATTSEGTSIDTYFSSVGSQFQITTEILQSMNVPPSWADIQAKLIAFYTAQADIYNSLGSGSDDPLRFMIALQRAPSQTQEAFNVLRDEIDQRIKDQKLG